MSEPIPDAAREAALAAVPASWSYAFAEQLVDNVLAAAFPALLAERDGARRQAAAFREERDAALVDSSMLRSFAEWLIGLDDPGGFDERRRVNLMQIIGKARSALAGVSGTTPTEGEDHE